MMNREQRRKFFKGCPLAKISKIARGEVTQELIEVLDSLAQGVKETAETQGITSMYLFVDNSNTEDVIVIQRNNDRRFDRFVGNKQQDVDFGTFKRINNTILVANYEDGVVKINDGQHIWERDASTLRMKETS